MLCQNCEKNQATRCYKSNINGKTEEICLCAGCAKELGYEQLFEMPHLGFGFDSLLSDFFGARPAAAPQKPAAACPLCGGTLEDISSKGRLGCEQCYDVFSQQLTPYLNRMYGSAHHVGRVPKSAGEEIKARRQLEQLRADLKSAVEAQEYEKAATLRDQIKGLEGDEQK